MKTKYENVKIEVIVFKSDDIIVTSGCQNPGTDDYQGPCDDGF